MYTIRVTGMPGPLCEFDKPEDVEKYLVEECGWTKDPCDPLYPDYRYWTFSKDNNQARISTFEKPCRQKAFEEMFGKPKRPGAS